MKEHSITTGHTRCQELPNVGKSRAGQRHFTKEHMHPVLRPSGRPATTALKHQVPWGVQVSEQGKKVNIDAKMMHSMNSQ